LTAAERLADAHSVQLPYLIVAAVLMLLAFVISRFPLPAMGAATRAAAKAERKNHSLWAHRNLVFGVPAERVLALASVGAGLVMLIASFGTGHIAMWALISVGLFHSIMFPTIFTPGIRDLGPLTEEGSGLLIMAIAGGALVVVQGVLADSFGLQASFLLTAFCELYVLFYALWGARSSGAANRKGALAA
jgi:FHS family L-fucose permease-like MFS transporter